MLVQQVVQAVTIVLPFCFKATMLLTMNKYSVKDAKDIKNSCFKLNSLQLHTLLVGYLYANNEPHIPPVSMAFMYYTNRAWPGFLNAI